MMDRSPSPASCCFRSFGIHEENSPLAPLALDLRRDRRRLLLCAAGQGVHRLVQAQPVLPRADGLGLPHRLPRPRGVAHPPSDPRPPPGPGGSACAPAPSLSSPGPVAWASSPGFIAAAVWSTLYLPRGRQER